MNAMTPINKIRVRLKSPLETISLFLLLLKIASIAYCDSIENADFNLISSLNNFELTNHSRLDKRLPKLFELNYYDHSSKTKRRHHRHSSHFSRRDSHRKRTANLIKADIKRDYVSAIVGKDVQLDCKIIDMVHDDDKVVFRS